MAAIAAHRRRHPRRPAGRALRASSRAASTTSSSTASSRARSTRSRATAATTANVTLVRVPGAWEIPLAVSARARPRARRSGEASTRSSRSARRHPRLDPALRLRRGRGRRRASRSVSLADRACPIAFGVLTTDTIEQADRARGHQGRQQGLGRGAHRDRDGLARARARRRGLLRTDHGRTPLGREAALQMLFAARGVGRERRRRRSTLFWRDVRRSRSRRARRTPTRSCAASPTTSTTIDERDPRGVAELAPRADGARRSQPAAPGHVGADAAAGRAARRHPRRGRRAREAFGTEESSGFVNGVLDRIATDLGRRTKDRRSSTAATELMLDLRFVAPDLRRLDEVSAEVVACGDLERRAPARRPRGPARLAPRRPPEPPREARLPRSARSARCSSCRRGRASRSTSSSSSVSGRAPPSATPTFRASLERALDALDGPLT